jgi:arabinofuranosyltransferase
MTSPGPHGDSLIARRWAAVIGIGFALLLVALVRTAWLSDDSFITFRTADNILNGYGPVWNTSERVQAFTHPLWLAVCTVVFGLTGEVFYSGMAVGIVVTLVAVALLCFRLAMTPWTAMVCFAALLSSKMFLDYSTSGLENPLTHLLLFLFMWRWWDAPPGPARVFQLSATAALCLLNRLDLAVLLFVPVAIEVWRAGLRVAAKPLLFGLLPLVAWELFSLVYYGTPFPNTAYAKLNTFMPASVLWDRGYAYLARTLWSDPATLPTVLLALYAVPAARRRHDWPLLAGALLFFVYLMRVGGDFMMGRFFTPLLMLAIACLARAHWARSRSMALVTATAVTISGLLAPWEPALLSGYGYVEMSNWVRGRASSEPWDDWRHLFLAKVMDERREYYDITGLLIPRTGSVRPEHAWSLDGIALRAGGRQVVVRRFIGMTGYFAGPNVHIVDEYALSDPLLARIPGGSAESTIGHLLRTVPPGYVATVESGVNKIEDPGLAAYYERLRTIVAGPIVSMTRMRSIAGMLAGEFNPLIDGYVASQKAEQPSP